MFDHDWFYCGCFDQQQRDARLRVALRQFPDQEQQSALDNPKLRKFMDQLECRTLVYLRDGFSYEVKGLARDLPSKSHLTFESEPGDDAYKVGSFVVSVPFEEICRVEVFAVHPTDKPENKPMITGFRSAPRDDVRE